MYCPNCGKEIDNGTKYCPYCGTCVDGNQQTFVPNTQAAEEEHDKEKGIVSMACGIASIVLPYLDIIFAIIAIIYSKKCSKDNSFAKVGKITGIIGLVLSILAYILLVVYVVLIILGTYTTL